MYEERCDVCEGVRRSVCEERCDVCEGVRRSVCEERCDVCEERYVCM